MVRDSNGKLVMVEWEDALVAVARALQSAKGDELAAIVGGFADAEVSENGHMNRKTLTNFSIQKSRLLSFLKTC